MRVSYSPGYFVPLPEDHPFPMGKFPVLRQILLAEGVLRPKEIVEPWEADWADLLLVHTSEYLSALAGGTLGPAGQRRLGLPWSEALVRRSRLAVQGTLNAAEMALEGGIAGNLAGGTHHAFADHGEGYCVLNDVAVAIRVLRARHLIRRALVVDLDVHQGNGTACIFAGDPLTYTFSMHGENNYPFTKGTSSLDVGLPDHTLDTAYLDVLAAHFTKAFEDARPDLVFYLAGVDPVAGDRFGRLALTRQGLRERDRYVLDSVQRHGAPVTLLLSGGYAKTAELTADLHATVYREAVRIFH
jgi:acetoin utilization deacetylase AcuC-like enzyme